MATMRIGAYVFNVNPTKVDWTYVLNTATERTKAGRVLQILSCRVDSITVQGKFTSVAEMERFEDFVLYHMGRKQPVDFVLPSRGWSARVRLTKWPVVKRSLEDKAPAYQLTLDVDEGLDELAEISKSDEFKAIVAGIQWRRDMYTDFDKMNEVDVAEHMENLREAFSGQALWQDVVNQLDEDLEAIGGESPSANFDSRASRDARLIGSAGQLFDPVLGVMPAPVTSCHSKIPIE